MGSYGKVIDGHEAVEKVYPVNSPWRNIKPLPLNDCPKCGAAQADRMLACSFFGFKIGADGWSAYCRNCNARTAFQKTYEDAVNKWNEGDIIND